MSRIFVTGLGVVSAIGQDVESNRAALINGQCGIDTLGLFPSKYAGLLPCGEVRIPTEKLQETLRATESGVTRTSLLALLAFTEAIRDAGLDARQTAAADTGLVGATTVGGMCLTDQLYHDANQVSGGSPYLQSYDCGSVALYIQERLGMRGPMSTINTACSSSANAVIFGARLIRSGRARRVIVGGADSLAKFTLNGFHALHILSHEKCRPFDRDRKGLNLGEGAAFLVLEKEEDLGGRRAYAELTGYGNANDSFHPSSLSDEGDGPFLSMQEALRAANLPPAAIGYINAHGTGTENNDLSESVAMKRLFDEVPPFSSTKSGTGHTLGAAGAVEAVYAVSNLYHQELYPSLQFELPIGQTGLHPLLAYRQTTVQHVMSNSFGFGGNCSSLIFSKT